MGRVLYHIVGLSMSCACGLCGAVPVLRGGHVFCYFPFCMRGSQVSIRGYTNTNTVYLHSLPRRRGLRALPITADFVFVFMYLYL